MFQFKPLGYRVLVEHIGERKLPTPIKFPNGSEMDAITRWVVRDVGAGAVSSLNGQIVPVTGVEIGDEIIFDGKRACECMPEVLNGGKRFLFVDVEAIWGTIKGEAELPPPAIAIARTMPSKLKLVQ